MTDITTVLKEKRHARIEKKLDEWIKELEESNDPRAKYFKRRDLELVPEWCQCGYDDVDVKFADDGVCRCGVYKHHYHCPDCGGITQVG